MSVSGYLHRLRRSIRVRSPCTIAGVYVLLGGFWIAVSDRLVLSLVGTSQAVTQFQTVKGVTFVLGSGVLVYGLVSLHAAAESSARGRVERQAQQLQVFNRVLRHNLRNDLNLIMGYSDRAGRQVGSNDVALAHSLRRIEESAVRILDLAGKARRITNVEPAAEATTLDLVDLLDGLIPQVNAQYPEATIRIDAPDTVQVRADETISIAIRELVSNGIVHDRNPSPEVDISVRTTLTSRVRIEIADTGPGIARSEVDPILSGEETPTEHTSSIGLWLVRLAVAINDGDLDFTVDDQGTTVTIDLPLAPMKQTAARVTPSE